MADDDKVGLCDTRTLVARNLDVQQVVANLEIQYDLKLCEDEQITPQQRRLLWDVKNKAMAIGCLILEDSIALTVTRKM